APRSSSGRLSSRNGRPRPDPSFLRAPWSMAPFASGGAVRRSIGQARTQTPSTERHATNGGSGRHRVMSRMNWIATLHLWATGPGSVFTGRKAEGPATGRRLDHDDRLGSTDLAATLGRVARC